MSMTTVLDNIDRVVDAVQRDKAEPVKKAAMEMTRKAKRHVQQEAGSAGYRGHSVAAAIMPQETHSPFAWNVIAAHPASQIFEFGSGIFGPSKKPIRPKSAKVLHFEVDGTHVFAREVEGRPPTPYMRPAWEEVQDEIPEIMGNAIWKDWRGRIITDVG